MPADEPSATIAAATADLPGILLRSGSWIRAGRIHAYDPATGSLADTGLAPAGPFDAPDDLVARELLVPSHDGVEIPLSIMHRRDLVRDGSNPVILSGYGAYGSTPAMQFSPTSLAWLERGGVLAVAHVRGGGTFGKAWHHAGRKTTKPNTWKDFLACGDYLVREGYTSPDRLAARGGSAGGILVGRAITERPDLFVAAQIAVGCTDMLRFEFTQNGPPNIPEFGSLADPEEFRGLLAMSTLHQVVDGTAYPAVLLTHGLNDPRVEPWQSFKTAARLQAATTSGRPVLLRLDGEAGHGIGSTRSQRHAELADVWSSCSGSAATRSFSRSSPPRFPSPAGAHAMNRSADQGPPCFWPPSCSPASCRPGRAAGPRERPPVPDLTAGGEPLDEKTITLGPTGMRGWVWGWKGHTTLARQILVTDVAAGSPAAGRLAKGDVIVGLAGEPFAGDARRALAEAITAAEAGDGRLVLRRWRRGRTDEVVLELPVLGRYGRTAPYDCPKSEAILAAGSAAIAERGFRDGRGQIRISIPDDLECAWRCSPAATSSTCRW